MTMFAEGYTILLSHAYRINRTTTYVARESNLRSKKMHTMEKNFYHRFAVNHNFT